MIRVSLVASLPIASVRNQLLREKVRVIRHVLNTNKEVRRRKDHSSSNNKIFLVIDIDVLPLQPFSSLLFGAASGLLGPRTGPFRPGGMYPEILFMREPEGSCGMTNWVANTGFILLRNTMAVQRFWYWVHVSMRGKMIDQVAGRLVALAQLSSIECVCVIYVPGSGEFSAFEETQAT